MGIVAMILAFFLILDVRRFLAIRQYRSQDYPHVPVLAFERWKRLELVSLVLLFLALVTPNVAFPIAQVVLLTGGSASSKSSASVDMAALFFVGGVATFCLALLGAAIVGSIAAHQRKTLDITFANGAQRGERPMPYPGGATAAMPPIPPASPSIVMAGSHAASPSTPSPGMIAGILAGAAALIAAMLVGGRWGSSLARSMTPAEAPATIAQSNSPVRAIGDAAVASRAKHVLALYYPWYQTPAFSHRWAHQSGVQTGAKRMASHTHYPDAGPYDSSDPAVIDRQLKQCEQAGIDTLVCSWWGRDDPTDHAIRVLLARAAHTHIKVCVLWEQIAHPNGWRTGVSELNYILKTFGTQPAYLRDKVLTNVQERNKTVTRMENKAVVFVFDRVARAFPREDWPQIAVNTDDRYAPGAMLIGNGLDTGDASLWAGQYTLDAMFATPGKWSVEAGARAQHTRYATYIAASRRSDHPTIVSVMPGYDDRKFSNSSGASPQAVIERENGRLYSALWQQAINDGADWVLINSFNQWHAGTEIEPSAELGDTYLRLTRHYADLFRQTNAHP